MLVPKLRFQREDGTEYPEYNRYSVGELTVFHKQGYYTNQKYIEQGIKIARVSDLHNPLIDYSEMPMVSMPEREYLAYKVDVNDFLIARSGSIGRYGIVDSLPNNERVVFGSFLIKFNFDNSKIINYYFGQFYDSDKVVKQLSQITQKGANVNINAENIKTLQISLPCLEEQQKIADFLSAVDEVIAQSEEEVQNLEQQKKAAMQKIFSQEVRFKREDGTDYPEWEEDTIGNCVNVTSCKRVHQSDWTDSGVPFYRAREIVALYNNEPITPLHISIEKYNALSKISGMISSGDLLVTGVGTIGVPYLVKESDKFYFKDGNIIWFQNEEKRALGSFLYYTLSTNEFQTKILQDSGKGTVHTFTIANAKETIIAIPCLEEQRKIAGFLSAYDEAISYAKQELEHWKQLKKGLLQQMFV